MSTQDHNNHEYLARQETSTVTERGILRKKGGEMCLRTAKNALEIMKATLNGRHHAIATEWGKRPMHWARESDFLNPVVQTVEEKVELDPDLELTKSPPSFVETAMYLDELNAMSIEEPTVEEVAEPIDVAYWMNKVDEIHNRQTEV